MWWAGSEVIHLFVGAKRTGLVRYGEACRWFEAEDTREALLAVAEELPRRSAVSAWLGGALARPFVLPPVEGLSRAADARSVAAARAGEETGLQGPCRVLLEHWRPGAQLVCVAADESVVSAIENVARDRNSDVKTIRPWWAVAAFSGFNARSYRLLTLEDPDAMVALGATRDSIEVAMALVPAPTGEQRAALLSRLVASTGGRRRQGVFRENAAIKRRSRATCPFGVEWSEVT